MNLHEIMRLRNEICRETPEDKSALIRDKLNSSLSSKIRTSFIGALASFEEVFGELWGHNEFKLTEEQKEFRKLWEKVRKTILDKGNDQIKLLKAELENYEYKGRKFNLELRSEYEDRV